MSHALSQRQIKGLAGTKPGGQTRWVDHQSALRDWLDEFPWLTGYLGDPLSPVWFIAECPSLTAIEKADKRERGKPEPNQELSENLQWNCHDKDTQMLREALTRAGLKDGDLCANSDWRCYLTNAVKEPQFAKDRNAQKPKKNMLREDANIWWPVLQHQIDNGKPGVLVPIGQNSADLLEYMRECGLKTSAEIISPIYQYSYIMTKPDRKMGLGPGHPARIEEFEASILKIAWRYGS